MVTIREKALEFKRVKDAQATSERQRQALIEDLLASLEKRVEAEIDLLQASNLRVICERGWKPRVGLYICQMPDGSIPQEDWIEGALCCGVWAAYDDLRFNVINAKTGEYLDERVFAFSCSVDEVWNYLVGAVCEKFEIAV